MENELYCKLLGKKIDVGLCVEILAVDGRMLKQSAVPETKQYTRDEIRTACDDCPYSV